uniref:Reverse transcriptase domain-containing protein n=1 Tax=Sphaeramia orbicularis TaxID=375764 RepID=A0A672ZSA2_9TELE
RCPDQNHTHTNVTIRFGLLNARSIANKSFSLNELFTNRNLDALFLTETWQRDGEFIHLNELCPPGCSAVGQPRPCRRGGGLAVVHQDKYICRGMSTDDFPSFESQMIKIGSSSVFYCFLIYRPPGPAGAFLSDFSDFLTSIIKLEKVLILGDFNLHIDNNSSSPAMELLTMTDTFNLKQHVSGPTHKKGHTLDLVFSLGLHVTNVCVEDVHLSDHCGVFFDLCVPLEPKPAPRRAKRRIITESTAQDFRALFNPSLLNECPDVDEFIQCFATHCSSVLDQVAPVKTNVTRKWSCPWINENILNLRRTCRKTERLWKSTQLEVHRLHLKDLITSLNKMIKEARSSYFHKLIATNKKNPKVIFDTIQSIVSPAVPAAPVLCKADSNDFLNFFTDKIRDIKHNIPPPSGLLTLSDPPLQTWSSFDPVTLEDISALLSKTKPSSNSADILPHKLLVGVFDTIGPWVTKFFNLSLSTGLFPSSFKQAIIEPKLKKTTLDPTDFKSYRPISKLPLLAKILEKAVSKQLTAFLETHQIYDTFQSGFRQRHSTETALLKVSSDILMAADSGKSTVLVLLDLSSAFDTVDHTIMIERLRDLVGMSGPVLDWFSSYLTSRSFTVSINNFQSDSADLLCGVPQGSVLGPVLFLLYVLPLGHIIRQYSDVSYHLFADDIQIYCSFSSSEPHKLSSLINCLSELKQWLNDNSLQLNSSKTETLIIAPDSAIPGIKHHLGDLSSSVKTKLRNLGVIFDQDMSLEFYSKHLVKNCFFHLRNISKLRSMVSTNELEMIVHAFVSSRLDYCNSLFTCLNKKELARLQFVQNSAARLLTRTNRRTHITPILKSLHWLPVLYRLHFKILVLTFRALHGQAPAYIASLIQPYSSTRSLRSSGQHLLMVPHTCFSTRGDRSFKAVAPRLWNDLPLHLRSMDSVESFKKHLKTPLFKKAF